MIVVTAPTGNIGSQVLARLLDGSEPVRVIIRDPSKLAVRVRERIEVIQGSHADAATVTKAFEGADGLFWLPPGDPTVEDAHAAYVDFCRAPRRRSPTAASNASSPSRPWDGDGRATPGR